MRWLFFACHLLLPLTVHAAGLQVLAIPTVNGEPALTGAVWTPCTLPPGPIDVGPRSIPGIFVPGTRDCPVQGHDLPLVVISHGVGGWAFGHHDLAETLADAGFVVAAINHPEDTGLLKDRSQANALRVWDRRPADIRRLIDYMLTRWPDHARIGPERIGFFGFSRGGFTGLVLIGGNPDFEKMLPMCAGYPKLDMCRQLKAGVRLPEPLPHDPRIRAAVLADPVMSRLFAPADLTGVTVPTQIWASQYGGEGVAPGEVVAMAKGLPLTPDVRAVRGAGHLAFLAPCGPVIARLDPEACTDRPGFDRVAFHERMDRAVLAFFQAHLPPSQ